MSSDEIDIPPGAGITLKTDGGGNRVTVGVPLVGQGCVLDVGGGCDVQIAPNCVLSGLFLFARAGAVIRIGPSTGFNGLVKVLAHERARIDIGELCLFGDGVNVTVSDMHSIIDEASGQRINPAADVTLGNHVWLGQNVLVLKGARIGEHTVVGANGLVTGTLPAHSLCVGSPARVIRSGITWRHDLI